MLPKTWTKEDVARALAYIEKTGHSQYVASKKYGVPQPMLSRRLNGTVSVAKAHEQQLKLPGDQAERLVEWILRQETAGFAPTHNHIRAIVKTILMKSGVPEQEAVVGNNWVNRFLQCHQAEIHTKCGKAQEAVRFDAFTPKAVKWYFEKREDLKWVKVENIVNVDKGGLMMGQGQSLLHYKASQVSISVSRVDLLIFNR